MIEARKRRSGADLVFSRLEKQVPNKKAISLKMISF
jgi:hypothetical protein